MIVVMTTLIIGLFSVAVKTFPFTSPNLLNTHILLKARQFLINRQIRIGYEQTLCIFSH
jgi:hypothetical protein